MKAIRRQAASAAALIAVTLVTAPGIAAGQCQNHENRQGKIQAPPNPAAPKLMIPTFHGDPKLGLEFSEALRDRVSKVFEPHTLWVIPCDLLNEFLKTSGYKPDSSLSLTDFKDLGRQAHALESMDGIVVKQPDGQIRVDTRLYYNNNILAFEAFPPAIGKDVGLLARQVADEYVAARKQFEAYQACTYAFGDGKFEQAAASAKQGIALYPKGLLSKSCLLRAYGNMPNVSPDSVIAIAKDLIAVDSSSQLVLAFLGDAYTKKGDTTDAVTTYLKLYNANTSNTKIARTVVEIIAPGAPEKALPIIDTLLVNNPGDASMMDTKFLLLLRAKRDKEAFATFDQLVKIDSSKGTIDYYQRVIGAAQRDSDQQMEVHYVVQTLQHYPKQADLWMLYSSRLRKAGKQQEALDAAKHAVDADPKVENGYANIVYLYSQLGQRDSALHYAQKALAAGADKNTVGNALLTLIAPAAKQAETSKSEADWQATLELASAVDSIAPGVPSKYYIGLSAAQVALVKLNALEELGKTDKPKACSETQVIDDLLATAQINMSAGGVYDKDSAGQIMKLVLDVRPKLPDYKKAVCKPYLQ